MTAQRIVFTGDFLRPSWDGSKPTQHYNIQWCRDLLGCQLALATGLKVEMLAWCYSSVTAGQLDSASVQMVYAALGLPCSINSWAKVYEARRLPNSVETFLLSFFENALVVGFELPPYLEHLLRRNGIPFVDIIIHPVRFLDDIFFGIRCSDRDANILLQQFAISSDRIRLMAGIQGAAARRLFDFSPEPDSALLLLQTRFDRTQICRGDFVGAIDFMKPISEIANKCSTLYVKDHPLDPGTRHATAVLSAFRNAEPVTHNVYSLLVCENITEVVTLSSSTGIEARYFGKNAKFLYKAPNRFAEDGKIPDTDEFIGVFDSFLATDFWRRILEPMVDTKKGSGESISVPFKPNRLRSSLKSFWNFNEIDTDYAVTLVKK